MAEAPKRIYPWDRLSSAGKARREAYFAERVTEAFPVPVSDLDAYFRGLTRGVSLRRVVEIKPGRHGRRKRGKQKILKEGHALITFSGPRSRIKDFKESVKKEKRKQRQIKTRKITNTPQL